MRQSNYPRGRVFSTPPPEFETKPFRLSAELLTKATFKNLNYRSLAIIVAAAVIVSCAIPILAGTPDNLWFVAGFAFLGTMALVAVALMTVAVRQRQALRHRVNAPLVDDERVVVSSVEGVRTTLSCGVDTFLPWTVISRVSIKPGWVELWFMTGSFLVVPTEAFLSTEPIKALKEFAKAESLEARL